jgi:chloramphenicol-sensitive protein RarD
MKNQKHLLAVLIAYLIWGSFPMFLRTLTEYRAPQILFYRIGFATCISLAVAALFRRKEFKAYRASYLVLDRSGRVRALINILGGGVLLSINWLLYIYTVNSIDIQTASFAYMLCPVLTALLGFIVLKEHLKPHHWLAIALSLFACLMLGYASLANALYSFAIALSYALYVIAQKRVSQFDRIITLGIQMVISMLCISPVFKMLNMELQADSYLLLMTFIMAVVFTVIPLLLSLYGLNKLSSGTIGFMMYINPIMNFFVAFSMYHEKASFMQVAAYLLTLVAVIVYNWEYLRKSR